MYILEFADIMLFKSLPPSDINTTVSLNSLVVIATLLHSNKWLHVNRFTNWYNS